MKTLYLLRHAKSSWDNQALADFDRPLNSEGFKEASFIGGAIYESRIQPDSILSSPAKRAHQTAVLVREAAQLEAKIEYEDKIYEASPHALVRILAGRRDEIDAVMLVGHNPGLENLIKFLTGELHSMPTAALARINLDIVRWNDISADSGKLESVRKAGSDSGSGIKD